MKPIFGVNFFFSFRKAETALRGKTDEDVLSLPKMKDTQKLGSMKIMNHVLLYLVYERPYLAALVACRMVIMTVEYGLCALSSVGFTIYGVVISRYE